MSPLLDPERARQAEGLKWMVWGPYLSERQWGTVREDYSADGTPWDYFPHEHARSRTYRWGEDGLGGFSDYRSRTCLAIALWNGRDSILKERLFGLTNTEANHGEDVKELYSYLDATPTHSYLRMLYKYPQAAFPYEQLADENRRRSRAEPEFELIDTGVFDEDRYFDAGLVARPSRSPDPVRAGRRGFHRAIRPGRLGHRRLRRQLQLARADLDAGQLPVDRVAAEVPPLLRARLQSGMPDRIRPIGHAARRLGRDCAPHPPLVLAR